MSRLWRGRGAPSLVALAALVALLALATLGAGCSDLLPIPHATHPDIAPDTATGDDLGLPTEQPTHPNTDAGPDGTSGEALTITAVDPGDGDIAGGYDLTITGTGFRDGLIVTFDESPSALVFVVNTHSAVARVPPHPAGRVPVSVAHPDDNNGHPQTLPNAFRYVSAIAVTFVAPARGPSDGGIPIAAEGRGFAPEATLLVDGRPALAQVREGDGAIRGILPPAAAGRVGQVDVQVVGANGVAILAGAFRYEAPPSLTAVSPIQGDAEGGTRVRLSGSGLVADSETQVVFTTAVVDPQTADLPAADLAATILDAAADGRWLDVLAPPGPAGALADVRVVTRAGVATVANGWRWRDPAADPWILACTHLVPTHGAEAGGDAVTLACSGLGYGGVQVTFAGVAAEVLAVDLATGTVQVRTPPGTGAAIVGVQTNAAATALDATFRYDPAPSLAVDSIAPAQGSPAGGERVTITGRGFGPGTVVQIGALPTTEVVILDANHLTATTPPGAPGRADVVVHASGASGRLQGGFDYLAGAPALALVAPPTAAQSGGTYLRVYGAGFTTAAEVTIGGIPCPVVRRVSSAELDVLSPRLEVGTFDAVLTQGGVTATLPRALTAYDPRTGYGGTWGPPIDEALNVTVYGSGGYGPVAGAFVIAAPAGTDASQSAWRGVTDDRGQLTLASPRDATAPAIPLIGPVDVTASKTGFTSYSVVRFDATNVTIILQQNPIPDQGNGGQNPPPPFQNATLSGHVLGLGKYVLAPPGSCAAAAIADSQHCAPCDPGLGCDAASPDEKSDPAAPPFACLDIGAEGPHCVAACLANSDCPAGYACGNTTAGLRCLPTPGERAAYCNVTSTSDFGYEYQIQDTGWADAEGAYQLDSRRLGDLAVYCFGGYRDTSGTFLPTVMGVRRHVFALPSGVQTGLDVTLDHPLKRTFRVRLMDPPNWATTASTTGTGGQPASNGSDHGLADPSIALTLDLGADGAIAFTRKPLAIGDDTFLLPNQLAALDGNLYDATYFIYTTLMPRDTAGAQPRSLNFVQNVKRIVEDRFPRRDPTGAWQLEASQLQRDVYAIWGPSAGPAAPNPSTDPRVWAVGEGGLILLDVGSGWTAQASNTTEDLHALTGAFTGAPGAAATPDLWAVGDHETVRHWTGVAWEAIPGPTAAAGLAGPGESFGAVAVTQDALYVAGPVRLRRMGLSDRRWSIVGGPALQAIRGLATLPSGEVLALGTTGRVYVGRDSTWRRIAVQAASATPAQPATLRAALARHDGRLVVVGDAGTMLEGQVANLDLGLNQLAPLTPYDLTAVTETAGPDPELVIVGDQGLALAGADLATLVPETIPDYRSKAFGLYAAPDGTVRVVGSAAFILGPFLHFPIVTAPLHDATLTGLAFGWTWDGGPANQYTRLDLTPEAQITLWTLIVDGATKTALLPDLQAAAGITALPSATRMRLGILRVLNQNFDIDDFTTREFSIYARDSWSTNEAWFYLP